MMTRRRVLIQEQVERTSLITGGLSHEDFEDSFLNWCACRKVRASPKLENYDLFVLVFMPFREKKKVVEKRVVVNCLRGCFWLFGCLVGYFGLFG